MMCTKTAPDIRYFALVKDSMSDDDIKIAVTKGIHENKTLDWCMLRWQMSDDDLNDLLQYLKEL